MRKVFQKIGAGFRKFMYGRYGSDKLNFTILIAGLVVSLLQLFMPTPALRWAFMLIS